MSQYLTDRTETAVGSEIYMEILNHASKHVENYRECLICFDFDIIYKILSKYTDKKIVGP